MAYSPSTDLVDDLPPQNADAFYRLEQAAEGVFSKELDYGRNAVSIYEHLVVARYIDTCDALESSAVWDEYSHKYYLSAILEVRILLADFHNSEKRRLSGQAYGLTPNPFERFDNTRLIDSKSRRDRVRLITNHSLFLVQKD
jgi:hypothetical protein